MRLNLGLAGYRRLLRSSRLAFRGDSFALKSAADQLKIEFLKNKNITDSNALEELYKGIDEVDEFLRFNLVQGKLNDRGNYNVNLSDENLVAVHAGQDKPEGIEFEPIDNSVLGTGVTLNSSKGSKKKVDKVIIE